jgi:glycosyltransferase involved in cell wall biosynthesis
LKENSEDQRVTGVDQRPILIRAVGGSGRLHRSEERRELARVLVTNFHPGYGGGHDTYIQTLTKISAGSDHVIGVAAPEQSWIYRSLYEQGFPVLYCCDFPAKIHKELPDIVAGIRRFRSVVSDFRPDIVHTNGGADLFIAIWSRLFSKEYAIIRTHHAIKPISGDIYHRWIYRKVTEANIYVSNSAMKLSTSKGLSPANAVVIENGVDLQRFSPVSKNLSLAKGYGIDEDTFCFGSCAGTGAYKRIDTIIKAAASLANCGKKFKILVLGESTSGEKMQDMATRLGVDQFVFCGFDNDIVPYVSLFDVGFVLSDSIETISYAAREMMAMGKPLISSSFSGLKENVTDGVNGFLVRPGNVDDVALAMKRFLEMDKETLMEFSRRARAHASNFDVNKQMRCHALLYDLVSRS